MTARLALSALCAAVFCCSISAASETPCCPEAPCSVVYAATDSPSWIFRRSTYTHDPYTGSRVAQYMRTPPVEPLDDERMVTSRYRRSRTNLRGAHGSVDTYYEVQAWGNGRGGIDAEWERFHDAWKESYLMGGYYNQGPGYGQGSGYGAPWGYGGGYAPGYGYPRYGFPGNGFHGPGHGGHRNGYGSPSHGHGGGHHHGGDGGNGQHGDDDDGHHGGGHHDGGHHNDGYGDDDGD